MPSPNRLDGRLPLPPALEVCEGSRRIRLEKKRSGESGVAEECVKRSVVPSEEASKGGIIAGGGVDEWSSGKNIEDGRLSSRIGDKGVAKKDEVSMADSFAPLDGPCEAESDISLAAVAVERERSSREPWEKVGLVTSSCLGLSGSSLALRWLRAASSL